MRRIRIALVYITIIWHFCRAIDLEMKANNSDGNIHSNYNALVKISDLWNFDKISKRNRTNIYWSVRVQFSNLTYSQKDSVISQTLNIHIKYNVKFYVLQLLPLREKKLWHAKIPRWYHFYLSLFSHNRRWKFR